MQFLTRIRRRHQCRRSEITSDATTTASDARRNSIFHSLTRTHTMRSFSRSPALLTSTHSHHREFDERKHGLTSLSTCTQRKKRLVREVPQEPRLRRSARLTRLTRPSIRRIPCFSPRFVSSELGLKATASVTTTNRHTFFKSA